MEHGYVVAMLSARIAGPDHHHDVWRHEIQRTNVSARSARRQRHRTVILAAARRLVAPVAAQTRQRPASSG